MWFLFHIFSCNSYNGTNLYHTQQNPYQLFQKGPQKGGGGEGGIQMQENNNVQKV